MANHRIPGPLGAGANLPEIDPGTLALVATAPPGSVGMFNTARLAVHTEEGEARGLTAGEIDMGKTLFKDAISYPLAKVHNGEYLWFGMQDDNTAMTPNGQMYFNPTRFKEDFSTASNGDKHWFMHEMVHVWQHQLGYNVWWKGLQRWNLTYTYALDAKKKLCDYDMEQQGEILADYFAIAILKSPENASNGNYADEAGVQMYLTTLADFLSDPADKGNLPK